MSRPTPLILVADDDADARMIMGAALRKAGYAVCMASGGRDALARFRADKPDLVMLDVEMPDLGGFEVCRLLRAEVGPMLPVVMVTGMDDLESVEAAYECGATDFIAKPVNWALISHRVRHLLRSYRALLDLHSAEARIAKLAYFDSLTGLPNRLTFLDTVDQAVSRASQAGAKLAVLFIDLDRFKTINDTLGHAAGDQLLVEAAARLRRGLRPSDLLSRPAGLDDQAERPLDLARMGGDEFTALITDIETPDDVTSIAQRICQQMRQPFVLEGREVIVTASVGVAMFPRDGCDGESLLKHADTAMYHAKRSGRDNAKAYTAAYTDEVAQCLGLESDLRKALALQQFHLVYQPKVDTASGEVHSVEALLRWLHPQRGTVSPMEFIPVVERIGLMGQIGRWVLHTACEQAVRWAQAGCPLTVAVNLSPLQFSASDLPQQVFDVLESTGLAPGRLELELTESALVQYTEQTHRALDALHQHGVQLALDDFGTGYSSLAYLTRTPIKHIKIDRCFVQGLADGGQSEAVVRAVLAVARSLKLRVTAEGVETLDQALALRAMGCDELQGYHFSRPVPASEIVAACARIWRPGGEAGHAGGLRLLDRVG